MGVYCLHMTRTQFEGLPSVLREIGLPEPKEIRDEAGFVYKFKLGVFQTLRMDVLKPEGKSETYELWLPPGRAGEKLLGELKRRGHYCDSKRKNRGAVGDGSTESVD